MHIYLCQKIDLFGAKMCAVAFFQGRGSRILLVVSYLLLLVEPLWDTILKSEMRRIECQGYIMMYPIKHFSPFLNCLAVVNFKVLSITKLSNIFESITCIGNPFHYYLSFSFYCRLCTEFRNKDPHIFLFIYILLYNYIVFLWKT